MLSDAKLGQFEVITPQQYNGYPWCKRFWNMTEMYTWQLEITFYIFQIKMFTYWLPIV